MQELFGSIRVELPEDPRQSARVVADVALAWVAMLEAIGLEVEAPLSMSETRAKRAARKPRLVRPRTSELFDQVDATESAA